MAEGYSPLALMFKPRALAIPVPAGRDITLIWPERLTEAQWGHFMTVLQAMKPGLVKHLSDEPGGEGNG